MALLHRILDHILRMPHMRGHRFVISQQAGHVGKPEQQSLGVPATGYGSDNVNIEKHTRMSCQKKKHTHPHKIHANKKPAYATQTIRSLQYGHRASERGATCSNLEKNLHEQTASEREDNNIQE